MKQFRSGALALLLLCAPFCFSQPKLAVVGGLTPDFGDIYTPSVEHDITLKNLGTDTLLISSVSTSCGCTAALVSNDHIPPGGSGTISVTFEAIRYSGPVEKAISFNTNDDAHKHVNITFKANVIKSITFDPEYFFFSTDIDSAATSVMTIRNSSARTIKIRSVRASSDLVSVKLSNDELQPGEEATLTCTIRTTEPGTLRGDIELTTDFTPYPRVSVGYFSYTKPKKSGAD